MLRIHTKCFGTIPPTYWMILSLGLIMSTACSSSPPINAIEQHVTPVDTVTNQNDLILAIGTSDIAIGPNRIIFAILDKTNGSIVHSQVSVSYYHLDSTPAELRSESIAKFVRWPTSNKGVYVSNVSFDEAGRWGMSVNIPNESDVKAVAQAGIIVAPQSKSPGTGTLAPPSLNKVAGDVTTLSELTTSPIPDPNLYQITVSEAIKNSKPTVVTFATPAFCTTSTCGPQVEVISLLNTLYNNRVNFIHIEVYDNPQEMDGDPSTAVISPILDEWGLRTEPFTFVLDSNGIIVSKYEGFVTQGELEDTIETMVGP